MSVNWPVKHLENTMCSVLDLPLMFDSRGYTFIILFLLTVVQTGRVIASDDWDEPPRHRKINPSLPNSIENVFHRASLDSKVPNYLLLFKRKNETSQTMEEVNPDLNLALAEPRLQRAIGVVYRPDTERWSHYFESKISKQFDAVVHVDTTKALKPFDAKFHPEREDETMPLTYPEGV